MGYNFGKGAGGFTQWGCKNISYTGCWTWGNTVYAGFNNENSDNTFYVNCVAGFAPSVADQSPSWSGTYPYANGDTLGNQHGFVIAGGYGKHYLTNCVSEYNPIHGVQITATKQVIVQGGSYCNNGGYGINQYSGGATDTTFYLSVSGATVKNNVGVHQISTIYDLYVDDTLSTNMIYCVYDTTEYYTIKTPRIKLNTDSLIIKNLSDGYIPIAKGGNGGALINSSIYSNLTDPIPAYSVIANRQDMWYFTKDDTYANELVMGYNKIVFVGNSGSDTIASYNIPMYIIMAGGYIKQLTEITLTNSNVITDESGYVNFNGGIKLGTDLDVAYGGTGASTLTGLLKGNGTGAFTAVTATTSADFVGGDFATHTLNQAAVSGLTTSASPQFAGINIDGTTITTISVSADTLFFTVGGVTYKAVH
jgi:hypothetical protein